MACNFLQKNGLMLVTKNFATPFGELDLIMEDKKTLIFVEVRCRQLTRYATSAESVDSRKQAKIIRCASFYLQYHPAWKASRFDVVAIQFKGSRHEINWIIDAFQVQ